MSANISEVIEFLRSKEEISCRELSAADISYDTVYRSICEKNSCGNYGRNYTCPPYCGEAQDLIEECKSYPKAFIYSSYCTIEDSFDFEGMTEGADKFKLINVAVQKKLMKNSDLEFRHLSMGGCRLCPKCACQEKLPCRNPKLALTSMEACCIDVSATAKKAGLKYTNGANTVTYFGLILYK